MPLQATSGAASYDAFGGGVPVEPNYIESVFSTFLYTGNGSTQTITNGIDLAGKGGLVWIKERANASNHVLLDTLRGGDQRLQSNTTAAQATIANAITSFNGNGFTLGSSGATNAVDTYASWTLRRQPKFFDVVTYTGNDTTRSIPHNLGAVPGCMIIKATNSAKDWYVYHRGMDATAPEDYYQVLNTTAARVLNGNLWDAPTSTNIVLNTAGAVNQSGVDYVAYLFAHNAGGFGLSGTDNVISCGSFTTDGSGNLTAPISLGYEPQWVLWKQTDSANGWTIQDNMRGMPVVGDARKLVPNTGGAESGIPSALRPTATGFTGGTGIGGGTFIYIAIRRGPMKVPTTGTSVFAPTVYTGTNVDNRLVNTSIVTDMAFVRQLNSTTSAGMRVADRLRGDPYLSTGATAAEVSDPDSFMTPTLGVGNSFSAMNGFGVGNDDTAQVNRNTVSHVAEAFARAPGFFDEVCYTGDASSNSVRTHNLNVTPELLIIKNRSAQGSGDWYTFHTFTTSTFQRQLLSTTGAQTNTTYGSFLDAQPTSTTFTVNTGSGCNASGTTYVAYLFASCPGVQSIQSFVGDGTTGRTINCGFTGGARFVCIKATSTTGSWWTFDSARGIVTNNDPALQLNSTAAEVTSADAIDTAASGFIVNQESTCSLNASGVTYLVWAIA